MKNNSSDRTILYLSTIFCITLVLVILILTEQRFDSSDSVFDSSSSSVSLGLSDSITGNVVLTPTLFSKTVGSVTSYCTDSDDISDGTGGKNNLTRGYCWAHGRRKFYEIIVGSDDPNDLKEVKYIILDRKDFIV